jgi:hypothetical protein
MTGYGTGRGYHWFGRTPFKEGTRGTFEVTSNLELHAGLGAGVQCRLHLPR